MHARESQICSGSCEQHTAGQEGMEIAQEASAHVEVISAAGKKVLGESAIWKRRQLSSLQRAYQAPPPGEKEFLKQLLSTW